MPAQRSPDGRIPVLLSAHEADLIGQDATAILAYLGRLPGSQDCPAAVAATLLRTRRVRRHRAVVRAADRTELAAGLRALADGDEHPLVAVSSSTAAPRTAFVFPGQGNQWPSMGADAYRLLPAYRSAADRCAEAFTAAALPSPLPYLIGGEEPDWSQLHIQAAQFTHSVALAQVWRSCGILPDVTLGHSLGEVAAGYVAGAVALPDAVAVVAARATVVDRLPGHYGMAVLGAEIEQAKRLIAAVPGWLEVSVVNAPSSTVVSGDRDAVAGVVAQAERGGVFVREIAVDFPAHTTALEPLRPMLEGLLPDAAFVDAPVEFIGSATGSVVPAGTDFAGYWYENLRRTVRFDNAVAAAVRRGIGAFVELSAHPSLLYALAELTDDALIVGSGRRDEPFADQLAANIAAAAVADPGYRWADASGLGNLGARLWLPDFPNVPMQAIHLWATPEPLLDVVPAAESAVTVAVEQWQPVAETASTRNGSPCRVAIVDSDGRVVTRQLAQALGAHHGSVAVQPADAEIVVIVAPALTDPDPIVAADEMTHRAGAGLPDYAAVVGPRCRNVWLLTGGGEQVRSDDPVALPAQAALAAMHRCVGFEFGDQTFGHLDLPNWDVDADTVSACLQVLVGGAGEAAVRDGGDGRLRRYVRTISTTNRSVPERPLRGAALDSVVITGGNGAIGLRYARYCVEHGAGQVVLLSRNGVEPDTLHRLTDGYGAEVHAPRCDITDPDALAAVVAQHAGTPASLLIHAAGVGKFVPHGELTETDLAAVFGAKVVGLAGVLDSWPLGAQARILLCSSVSAVWGGRGHVAYAASNRMLEVLAGRLRAQGLDCTAVRWGLWPGAGILEPGEVSRIETSGLLTMDADAAIQASLRPHDGDPLIFRADFDRLRMFFESQGVPAPLRGEPPAGTAAFEAAADARGVATITEIVRGALAAALSAASPDSVDLNTALVDLGVDSLLALDLRKRLRRSTGRAVPLGRLLGGITGAQLIDDLQSEPVGEPATPQSLESQGRLGYSRD